MLRASLATCLVLLTPAATALLLAAPALRRCPPVSRVARTADRFAAAQMAAAHSGTLQRQPADGNLLPGGLLKPIRRMLATIAQFFGRLVRRFTGASKLPTAPTALTLLCSGERSIANLVLVQGLATRNVPVPDEMLAYFGYNFSPFYAELPLPAEQPSSSSDEAAPPGDNGSAAVRWLRHRCAPLVDEFGCELDQGRLRLLRELYEEALSQERGFGRRKVASGGLFDGWRGGATAAAAASSSKASERVFEYEDGRKDEEDDWMIDDDVPLDIR
jgi:hypothetical protein